MANAIKKALAAKQAKQDAHNKAQSPKLKAKDKAAMQGIGAKIVQTAIEAHSTTKEMLQACKGKSAEAIEVIKESVAEAWKKHADSLTARNTHSSRDTVEAMRRQSIYNRNSEMQAILNAYAKYAALDKKQRAEFDKRENDCTSYHPLVAFCRFFNRGNKKSASNSATPAAVRERKAWQKNKSERISKVKDMVRFASLDALIVLEEFISKRIEMEKRSLQQKSKGEQATVRKLRKAA